MEKPLTVVVSDETILPEICGANDSNLKVIEELLGVRVFSRGNEILLDTSDDSIQRTFTQLLQQLEDHIRLGQLPGPGPHPLPAQLPRERRGREGGDPQAEPRRHPQRACARSIPAPTTRRSTWSAIERNELVFGVGPAGTGKTYLAVAQALKQVLGQARRKLIITRPVVEAGESLGFLPGRPRRRRSTPTCGRCTTPSSPSSPWRSSAAWRRTA